MMIIKIDIKKYFEFLEEILLIEEICNIKYVII